MNKRYCSVLSMVVTLILATTTAFAGSPNTSGGRESWGLSNTPKTWDSAAHKTWGRQNFNEMYGEDTVSPGPESSDSTQKSWAESIFSDYRLVRNGMTSESEVTPMTELKGASIGYANNRVEPSH